MRVSLGEDRVVEAKIIEKEKAEGKYEDAIAGSHGAVIMKQNETMYELRLGNLFPGETAKVELEILQTLKIR